MSTQNGALPHSPIFCEELQNLGLGLGRSKDVNGREAELDFFGQAVIYAGPCYSCLRPPSSLDGRAEVVGPSLVGGRSAPTKRVGSKGKSMQAKVVMDAWKRT